MEKAYKAVIMAGGVGSRFWPSSRENKPKQFLDILGHGKSLIRLTYDRFRKILPPEQIYVVSHIKYAQEIKNHLPEITDVQIINEPERRNTAPCLALTAVFFHQMDENSVFIAAPADHIILEEERFLTQVKSAFEYASNNDALVTLGMQPTRPDTGYGYINYDREGIDGIHKVIKFTEKPDLETATAFVDGGVHLWNAGIFIWSTKALLSAFESYSPITSQAMKNFAKNIGADDEEEQLKLHYAKCEKTSIDYAILEKAQNVYTLPSSFGWSDLGTWGSVYEEMEKDDDGMVFKGLYLKNYDSANCLVRLPKNKVAVIKDLKDYIVIDEEDVLLILPRNKEQEIKQIRNDLENGEETNKLV